MPNAIGLLARRDLTLLAALFLLFFCKSSFAIDIKVDRVQINVPAGGPVSWASVTFQQTFGSVPMVFVNPTESNPDPATVRIRNVTTTGFEVGVVESPGEDGITTAMTVDYFAAEVGTYVFPGGIRMVVGSQSIANFQGRNVSGSSWAVANFGFTFGSTPGVVTQIQTINSQPTLSAGDIGVPFLEVAMRNVNSSSMEIALERGETSTGTVVAETVGFLAMESGDEVEVSGTDIKALRTAQNIRGWANGCFTTSYSSPFTTTPLIIASQNTRQGGDGGWARRCSVTSTEVGLNIDEDRAADTDRSHTNERAGVLAIESSFSGSRNGNDLEAGQVTIASTGGAVTWTDITFPNPFDTTPRIFVLPSNSGALPASVRVRNVTINGFQMAAFQPTGGLGAHPQMEVDYVAIEDGVYILASGDVFEVGVISTNLFQAGAGGSTGTETINFLESFSVPPATLFGLQTVNNEINPDPNNVSVPWMTVAVTNLVASSATVAIERAEASAGTISQPEELAYFAVRDAANGQLVALDSGSVDYEMFNTPDNILGFDDGCFFNSYADTYVTPHVVASQITRDGNNGGWVRQCGIQTTQIGLFIDEDQANDSERSHTTEEVAVFVFERAFEADLVLIDHYAILHSGAGVTCEAEPVTIIARSGAGIPVDAATRTIRVTATSTTPGWTAADVTWSLQSGTGTFASVADNIFDYTFDTGESSFVAQLGNISSADIDIDIVDLADSSLTDVEGSAEDPILTFSTTGLRFFSDANNDGDADGTTPIPDTLTAGQASIPLIVRAVQTSTETGVCEARITGPQTVNFGYMCINPFTCVLPNDAQINSTPIEENNFPFVADYTPINLTFDADGEAQFTVTYFDVGLISLHANVDLPASGGDPAITLTGVSGSTISRPADLVITTIEGNSGESNGGTTTSGAGFLASGTPFRVVVEAQNAIGNRTPNFGNEFPNEELSLAIASLVMPSGGTVSALTSFDTFSATAIAGEFENTTVTWPEAGTITLETAIRDGDYLGSGNVSGTASGNVGRFFPAVFDIDSIVLTPGCDTGGFSYMSDASFSYLPLTVDFQISAVSAGSVVLQNYDAGLGYPVGSFTEVAEQSNSGTDLGARLQIGTAIWENGIYQLISPSNVGGFSRLVSGANEIPDGPLDNVQLGLTPSASNIDVTMFVVSDLNMNAANIGDCAALADCDATMIGAAQRFLFGRLSTSGVHGPETSELNAPFNIEFWNGTDFETNVDDSCTAIPFSAIAFDGDLITVDSERTVAVGTGNSTGSFSIFTPGVEFMFNNGDAELFFSAPGAGNTGSFNIDVDLTSLPWLRSDLNSNGDASDDTALPAAEISFGNFRGHDRIIFWREVLN